ncbi:MAG: hypothetical protein NTW73_00225 [Candidatus Parcubacteria bacterium]|nr:hypothetical protein [Candidatus Parcubacteria bacterium]
MKESSKQSLAILAITVFLSGSLFIFFNVIKPGLSKVKGIIAERKCWKATKQSQMLSFSATQR